MRQLTLTEYRTMAEVVLSAAERDALRQLVPGMTIAPSMGREGCYDLRPDATVGSVNLSTLAVEIRPKLPMERVLFLLSYALGLARWPETPVSLDPEAGLLEAVIPGFVYWVRQAMAPGVLQGYRPEEAALMTVRGRLRLDEQLRAHYGRVPPAECRYDEFTEDIEENRLLRAAITRLGRLRLRSPQARRALRAVELALASVGLVEYDTRQLPEITFTRLNEHYRPALALARLILQATSLELRHGPAPAAAFLVDMNKVFEDFIVVALREVLDASPRTLVQGGAGHGLHLDEAGRVGLKPDLSWWDGLVCTFVGDVKYKRTGTDGSNDDLYQLLAYAIATGLPGGLLIYAAGEAEPIRHRVVWLGKVLEVMTVDLKGDAVAILRSIERVEQRIRELRDQGRAVLALAVPGQM